MEQEFQLSILSIVLQTIGAILDIWICDVCALVGQKLKIMTRNASFEVCKKIYESALYEIYKSIRHHFHLNIQKN